MSLNSAISSNGFMTGMNDMKTSKLNISNLNPIVRDNLEAWLKYGTMFFIYRIFTYFFIDGMKTPFFQRQQLLLVIFILIGFSIYYTVINPFIPVNFRHPVIRNIGNDTLMFGTVLITTHILETFMNKGSYFNKDWFKNAFFVLIAFASYRVAVDPFIPRANMNPKTVSIINDVAQFGVFLIVYRFLEQKSIIDQKWILSVLFVLLGFTGYHVITERLIKI